MARHVLHGPQRAVIPLRSCCCWGYDCRKPTLRMPQAVSAYEGSLALVHSSYHPWACCQCLKGATLQWLAASAGVQGKRSGGAAQACPVCDQWLCPLGGAAHPGVTSVSLVLGDGLADAAAPHAVFTHEPCCLLGLLLVGLGRCGGGGGQGEEEGRQRREEPERSS